jgi:xanthine dehydrogenase YagT iron-sulfur-binding subunit
MKQRKRKGRDPAKGGVSRRDFLTTGSLGAVGIAAAGKVSASSADADASAEAHAGEKVPVRLEINGFEHRLLVEPRWSLAYVLRESLRITGTKLGCDRGECGSCTVLIDDVPRYACMTLVLEVEGARITTLEGLLEGEVLGDVQQAFLENDAFQCGYCTPGQIMAVEGLLRATPDPSLDEVRVGVSGNLCRCGAYVNIFRAVHHAAELKRQRGGAS